MADKKDRFELFLISFLALFIELAIIRWLSTEVRIFAYFKNLPLMVAFLGFGVGCFLYKRSERLFYFWLPIRCVCWILIISRDVVGADLRFDLAAQFHRHQRHPLVMILFANLLAAKFSRASFTVLSALLTLTLVGNFVFPLDAPNQLDWVYRFAAGAMLVTCPLFMAALIFAKAFAQVISSSAGLASNLFGALVGGLLEYLDMWTGLRWLNLIALALYLVSFYFLLCAQRAGAAPKPA